MPFLESVKEPLPFILYIWTPEHITMLVDHLLLYMPGPSEEMWIGEPGPRSFLLWLVSPDPVFVATCPTLRGIQ